MMIADDLICLADLCRLIRSQSGFAPVYHRLQRLALNGDFEVQRVGGRCLVKRTDAKLIAEAYKKAYADSLSPAA
jgi:hypothetical protein